MKIEVGNTYRIRTTGGGHTFGTVTEISGDGTFTYESDHPEAVGASWARTEQAICQVADGTFLGDDGKPQR